MIDKLTKEDRRAMIIAMNDTYTICVRSAIQRLASIEANHQAAIEHLSLCDTSKEFYEWVRKQRKLSTRH